MRYRVEILRHGHEIRELSVQELQELQEEGYIIAVQVGETLRQIHQLNEENLRNAPRIIATPMIRGG